MSRRRWMLAGLFVLTIALIAAVLTDALPWLRGPAPDTSVWHWPYALRPAPRWWAPLLAAAVFLAGLALWLRPAAGRGGRAVALAALLIGCLGLQLGLLYADRDRPVAELVDRTLAVQTNGYFWTAARTPDLGALLREYPTAMAGFESDHARTHPPGLVAINWLSLRLLQRLPLLADALAPQVYPLRCTDLWLFDQPPATAAALLLLAWLPLLLGAAALFPAAWLARALGGARPAVLVAALPALLIFAPLPDQLFAALTLLIVGAFYQGWRSARGGWFLLSGTLLSLASFLSLGNAALLPLLGIFGLFLYRQRRPRLAAAAGWAGLLLLGTSLLWLGYWAGWGVAPWRVARTGLDAHFQLVGAQRSYGTWLPFNLLDLALFSGVPLAIAFAAGVAGAVRALRKGSGGPVEALTASTAFLLLLLLISGSTRGEVGRIWLFLMPLLALGGAFWLAAGWHDWRAQWMWGALQVAWAVALGLSWQPLAATIVVAERPPSAPLPAGATPSGAAFGSQITLEAYALAQTAEALTLTLAWHAAGPTARPYTVFNHLVDEAGMLAAQADGWPVDGRWPPSCWEAEERVVAVYRLALPPDLPAGRYTLLTGFYDARDGARLSTTGGVDALPLGSVAVGPPQ